MMPDLAAKREGRKKPSLQNKTARSFIQWFDGVVLDAAFRLLRVTPYALPYALADEAEALAHRLGISRNLVLGALADRFPHQIELQIRLRPGGEG